MAINFPTNPSVNQYWVEPSNGVTYKWDGSTWTSIDNPVTQGPRGFQGDQGNQGFQGTQGFQGNQGDQGTQGFPGDQGNQGFQGTQGFQGNQGDQGPQGFQGFQGQVGSILAMTSVNFTSPSIDNMSFVDFTIPVGELALQTGITLSHPSWLRLYRSSADREADLRVTPGGTLQAMIDLGDSKPHAEFVTTTTSQTIYCNPTPSLRGDGTDPVGLTYARLMNRSGSTRSIDGTITLIQIEP